MTKRVLVVEDAAAVVSMLRDFFAGLRHAHGYAVEAVADGADALAALLRERFDLVMLDMQMPRMGGLDLLSRMRHLGIRVPVLMLTANTDTNAAARALGNGIFAYIPKPANLVRLEHLVALALAGADRAAASPTPTG